MSEGFSDLRTYLYYLAQHGLDDENNDGTFPNETKTEKAVLQYNSDNDKDEKPFPLNKESDMDSCQGMMLSEPTIDFGFLSNYIYEDIEDNKLIVTDYQSQDWPHHHHNQLITFSCSSILQSWTVYLILDSYRKFL